MCMQALPIVQADNDALVAEDPSVDKITYGTTVSTTRQTASEARTRDHHDSLSKVAVGMLHPKQRGATFDDHFDDAFKQIFDMGYEHIVSVGGDVPTMPITHISQAFQWLDYFQDLGTPGFVQAPCQECGITCRLQLQHADRPSRVCTTTSPASPALDAYVEKAPGDGHPLGVFHARRRHR